MLRSEIADVVRGTNVRCAVAFRSSGAIEDFFGDESLPTDARIICDLTIAATNPRELRAMGAPDNVLVRHFERLHAKVYMSDHGAFVRSAKATNNGSGLIDLARLVEAGVFIGADSDAYADARDWFKRIWRGAACVARSRDRSVKQLAAAKAAT